jgi:redox-sensing transcriptional repressor
MEIPYVVVKRLCRMLRLLEQFNAMGREHIFADEIEKKTGIPSYQIRKDVSYIGRVGKPGRGYSIRALLDHIKNAFNLNRKKNAVLVADSESVLNPASIENWLNPAIELIAVFRLDSDANKKKESGVPEFSINKIQEFLSEHDVEIAVISLAEESIQEYVDMLVQEGITGILNIGSCPLHVPDEVAVQCIDLPLEMMAFSASKSLMDHNTVNSS